MQRRYEHDCTEWRVSKDKQVAKCLKNYRSVRGLDKKYKGFIKDVTEAGSADPVRFTDEPIIGVRTRDGHQTYSVYMTADLRLKCSIDYDRCVVTIWVVGDHKEVYGKD